MIITMAFTGIHSTTIRIMAIATGATIHVVGTATGMVAITTMAITDLSTMAVRSPRLTFKNPPFSGETVSFRNLAAGIREEV
jgi:L-serine deaminase